MAELVVKKIKSLKIFDVSPLTGSPNLGCVAYINVGENNVVGINLALTRRGDHAIEIIRKKDGINETEFFFDLKHFSVIYH